MQVYKGKDGNGPKIAVAGLSLAINRQECFGLLGPNGAGKTTTIRVSYSWLSGKQQMPYLVERTVYIHRQVCCVATSTVKVGYLLLSGRQSVPYLVD